MAAVTQVRILVTACFILQENEAGTRKILRRPGIEPGSTAWKAAMLTIIPPTHPCSGTIFQWYHFQSVAWQFTHTEHGENVLVGDIAKW